MRRLFTTEDALADGLTLSALKWGEAHGRWRRVRKGVYGDGPDEPTAFDHAAAEVLARRTVARGGLAGVLYGLDNVGLDGRPVRRRPLPTERIVRVGGFPCTDGVQTMVDLAAVLDDLRWEQALESALRKGLVSITALEELVPELGQARAPGTSRIRRVLQLRPDGAPPTGSLLETYMIQLIRTVPEVPDPVRQLQVGWALLDQSWPDVGLFIELDGQQHAGQPVYDARRETAVVAATGWLCGRFTWHEVVRLPTSTGRRLSAVYQQALLRPMVVRFVHP